MPCLCMSTVPLDLAVQAPGTTLRCRVAEGMRCIYAPARSTASTAACTTRWLACSLHTRAPAAAADTAPHCGRWHSMQQPIPPRPSPVRCPTQPPGHSLLSMWLEGSVLKQRGVSGQHQELAVCLGLDGGEVAVVEGQPVRGPGLPARLAWALLGVLAEGAACSGRGWGLREVMARLAGAAAGAVLGWASGSNGGVIVRGQQCACRCEWQHA
jgi:hypothetical protein